MKNTLIQLGQKVNEFVDAYLKTVPTDTVYPYGKYNFLIPTTSFKTQTGDFTIDVYSNNVAEAINIADDIWKGLDGYTYSDINTSLYVRQSFMTTIEDIEKIHTISLTFMVLFEEE